MDHVPHNNAFQGGSMFADSQFNNGFDDLFPTDSPQSYDASWGVNASTSDYDPAVTSAAQPAVSTSQHNANQLSAPNSHASINGQATQFSRSPVHSPTPYGQFAYNAYGNQSHFPHQHPQYDSVIRQTSSAPDFTHSPYSTYGKSTLNAGTIAPQAIENEPQPHVRGGNAYDGMENNFNLDIASSSKVSSNTLDQTALAASMPKGANSGMFSIINFDQLSRANNSERLGNFVNVGRQSHEFPVNRTVLQSYVPRKSRSELRKLAAGDSYLLAKIGKKSMKKEKLSWPPSAAATTTPGLMKTPSGYLKPVSTQSPADRTKYEGESSSSEEESSSDDDDDSSYTSDDTSPAESSPLPPKRPEDVKGAMDYDAIKAVWRPKKRDVTSEDIKKGLVDFWEIVRTIRDRWKADGEALKTAEDKKRVGELPLLRSRIKDQRDMCEAVFKAALKYGHRTIVELFAENVALMFLCYQFLNDRLKEDDINSALSRAILEILTICTTLTEAVYEKTHLIKVIPRYQKKGDAKTVYYAKRVASNAVSATKDKQAKTDGKGSVAKLKEDNGPSPTSRRATPEAVAGVKRQASNAAAGGVQKKVATENAKAGTDAVILKAVTSAFKKGPTTSAASKTSAAVNAGAPTSKPKAVVAKPSGFFSSLQSAAKKPGTQLNAKPAHAVSTLKAAERNPTTSAPVAAPPKPGFSFAETMANLIKPKGEKSPTPKPEEKQLPPETAEEKAKRLRKEERRKLRVSFKAGEDLVVIHWFNHEAEEEEGHDASQTRDVADVGGEGAMLKRHMDMMDVDDEDDDGSGEIMIGSWHEPSPIDFSPVDVEERKRNYAPYGGGEMLPDSLEKAAREQYERNTLMVTYISTDDVPPWPKEPTDPHNGVPTSTKAFGAVPEKVLAKLREQQAVAQQNTYPVPAPALAPQLGGSGAMNLSAIMAMLNPQQQHQAMQTPQQNDQPTATALESIFAQFSQQQPQNALPPAGMPPGFPAPAAGIPFANMVVSPPQQQQQPQAPQQTDLSALLATFGPPQPGAAPMMGGYHNTAPDMMGYQAQPQQNSYASGSGYVQSGNQEGKKTKPKNYRTMICKYWRDGTCKRGDSCTYLHENKPGAAVGL